MARQSRRVQCCHTIFVSGTDISTLGDKHRDDLFSIALNISLSNVIESLVPEYIDENQKGS
jgi:hypothetical protein